MPHITYLCDLAMFAAVVAEGDVTVDVVQDRVEVEVVPVPLAVAARMKLTKAVHPRHQCLRSLFPR